MPKDFGDQKLVRDDHRAWADPAGGRDAESSVDDRPDAYHARSNSEKVDSNTLPVVQIRVAGADHRSFGQRHAGRIRHRRRTA